MRKLAVPLITFLALALLIGTIAYVVSAVAAAPMTMPASASMPRATPVLTPEPTPTTVPAATPTPTLFPAPALAPTIEQEPASDNVTIHRGEQPPYATTAAGYDRVQLVNNGSATDPTWQQLMSFLIADKTNEKAYVTGTFMCGAFAEDLYNNAELLGSGPPGLACPL